MKNIYVLFLEYLIWWPLKALLRKYNYNRDTRNNFFNLPAIRTSVEIAAYFP